MKRAINFNPGPAALPEWALEEAKKGFINYQNTGMSVMELSHRSKTYEQIHNNGQALLRKLMNINDDYEVLFLQGGASLQFSMVPMNLLTGNKIAYYILTGSWSEKALKEGKKIGKTAVFASAKEGGYRTIPHYEEITQLENAAYLHITSNNTIFGTQWKHFPDTHAIPLIADMSSDILSKKIDINQFALIYAGAQKNLGPSGVTVVIIKKDLLKQEIDSVPTMLQYQTYAASNSLYNTPPTFSIYMLSLVLQWVENYGGIGEIEKINQQKADLLYEMIDNSHGFYRGHAEIDSRSNMNVTFTLPSTEITEKFLAEAKESGFVGLNGHRSVGGCRASIYNAVPLEHVEALGSFMEKFKNQYS
ncbi:3-phosphoserine/phosphohydroxythreonine transaminase [Bacillaceae bacterium Marseille-Q3522]|nr:3-phosphoserine/phosphohydroxythreonine transaminase [Bacillaceae bacterium Marseille-Q3522]